MTFSIKDVPKAKVKSQPVTEFNAFSLNKYVNKTFTPEMLIMTKPFLKFLHKTHTKYKKVPKESYKTLQNQNRNGNNVTLLSICKINY